MTASVLIVTDLEGTAGVTSFASHAYADAPYLDRCRRLATAEVNAAIEGLLAADVGDILVFDGHGCEGLWYEDLHPAARLLHGRPLPPWSVFAPMLDQYDAAMIIGQHSMAGIRDGNMNHTQDSRSIDSIKINGRLVGEVAQLSLYLGDAGIPLVFLSGDAAACREAEELNPKVATVAVKVGIGRNAAISLSATEARRRIREGVTSAIKGHRVSPVAPLQWSPPFTLEKRFFHTDAADASSARPGAERVDSQTVRFHGSCIRDIVYS